MTTLFDSARTVKTTRRNRLFSLGLGRHRAERLPVGPSAEDAAWWASESNRGCRDYTVIVTAEDRHFDRMAEEAAQMDLVERGLRGW